MQKLSRMQIFMRTSHIAWNAACLCNSAYGTKVKTKKWRIFLRNSKSFLFLSSSSDVAECDWSSLLRNFTLIQSIEIIENKHPNMNSSKICKTPLFALFCRQLYWESFIQQKSDIEQASVRIRRFVLTPILSFYIGCLDLVDHGLINYIQ